MPKEISSFEISLEKPQAVFFAGDKVKGWIRLILLEAITTDAVKLRVKGCASCRWLTHIGNTAVIHTGKEDFIEQVLLIKGDKEHSKFELTKGEHSFPFEFTLPVECPTSFEGSIGHIRYVLKAIIDRPLQTEIHTKKPITVTGRADLNLESDLAQPTEHFGKKTFGLSKRKVDTSSISVKLPKSGYVPGEEIKFVVRIENPSKHTIRMQKVKLVQHVTYASGMKGKRHVHKTVVSTLHDEQVAPGHDKEFENSFRIPSLPPTMTKQVCKVVRIHYNLVVKTVPEGLHSSFDVHCPIVIGTIPFESQTSSPSYNEAIGDKEDIREESDDDEILGELAFAPVYPYYGVTL